MNLVILRKRIKYIVLAALSGCISLPALAMPFSATPPATPGPLNGGAVTYSITSPGASAVGAATLTFDLLGYWTVDGLNGFQDTFTLKINGTTLFSGGFDMGGGGPSFINFIAPGVTILNSISYGIGSGGLTQFSVAHTLLSGANNYVFDYGAMQGIPDEGWGLRSIAINANVNAPEPETLALLAVGIAGIGLGRYRKPT